MGSRDDNPHRNVGKYGWIFATIAISLCGYTDNHFDDKLEITYIWCRNSLMEIISTSLENILQLKIIDFSYFIFI